MAGRAWRGICSRFRETGGTSCNRSYPRETRRVHRRSWRDRVLSADDRRLTHATPVTIPITIRLQQDDFDVSHEIRALTHGRIDIGAVVTFSGICRGGAEGGVITALTLEHYPGMADAEIRRHVDQAIARWPLTGVTIIHRYGHAVPGDNIVLVLTIRAPAGGLSGRRVLDGLLEG